LATDVRIRPLFSCRIINGILPNYQNIILMHYIDWSILIGSLVCITAYGLWKTRGKQDMHTYLVGHKDLKWWTIGLSIMATQASAITFLSTTGQGYEDGMRFAQFYIGLPVAMVVLSAFFLPIYYRLQVMTAYQYLEQRFDLRLRSFTAFLFLVQRGMGAGLTISAPAIVLSTLLGWDWVATNLFLGTFVIVYTVFGGSDAVSVTQQQQMIVILGGLLFAFALMIARLPPDVSVLDAARVAGKLNKTNILDFSFDWKNKYTFWSGMLGGTFLFLSYFGTDQSQVQRYLSGKTMIESRLGLLFNGLVKVPMQFLVLMVGVMMFIFYQFNRAPIHFNEKNVAKIATSTEFKQLENQYQQVFEAKKTAVYQMIDGFHQKNPVIVDAAKAKVLDYQKQEQQIRTAVKKSIKTADASAETNDRDYTFITFVMQNLPVGVIGILLAVIFAAAMSSTAAELNALATTTIVDFYQRQIAPNRTDAHYMLASQWFTIGWGILIMLFAMGFALFQNLIEAVNTIGSLFYGTILGIFAVGFFLKNVGAKATFWGAVVCETVILLVYLHYGFGNKDFPFLWLNPAGAFLTIGLSCLFEQWRSSKDFV
jgi:solute:Na+ symporter, SSS family